MPGCHSPTRLKYAAELNYIFIIANGPRCPITAVQYIFNNPTCLSDCLSEQACQAHSPGENVKPLTV